MSSFYRRRNEHEWHRLALEAACSKKFIRILFGRLSCRPMDVSMARMRDMPNFETGKKWKKKKKKRNRSLKIDSNICSTRLLYKRCLSAQRPSCVSRLRTLCVVFWIGCRRRRRNHFTYFRQLIADAKLSTALIHGIRPEKEITDTERSIEAKRKGKMLFDFFF